MNRKELLAYSLGQKKASLVLKNAKVIDVLAKRILPADVAVQDGYIVGVGSYSGERELDCRGAYLSPGFINCHCHIESAMVTPDCYAIEEAKWGVTTIVCDPHEIANVCGIQGIEYMLSCIEQMPIDCYLQLPSCVPATPFENAGAVLSAKELSQFLNRPHVLGLGEVMNVPGVLGGDDGVWEKLLAFSGRLIDGHAPGLSGNSLDAYIVAGIQTDHEATTFAEALEKVSKGMKVFVRQGSASRNLENIMAGFLREKLDTANLAFCTDDKHLPEIKAEGTIAHCVRMCVAMGFSPLIALQMATINAARALGLSGVGAIAPGYRADLVLFDQFDTMDVRQVFKNGVLIAEERAFVAPIPPAAPCMVGNSVRLPALTQSSFALNERERMPVIVMLEGEILTGREYVAASEVERLLKSGELCKIAVIERHKGTGNIGVGLLKGYSLRQGAVASTVAHDSHNLIVVGDNDCDMVAAATAMQKQQGGFLLVQEGRVTASLPLPVAGLMSRLAPEQLSFEIKQIIEKIHVAGVKAGIDPLVTLSFMALPVIPQLRITDKGVFDVEQGEFVL